MPNYYTHLRIGFYFSIFISTLISILGLIKLTWSWYFLAIPVIIYLYSNLPDVDHHMGKIRKILFATVFCTMIIIGMINYNHLLWIYVCAGFLGLAIMRIPHRGPTHNYIFILITSSPLLLYHWFLFAMALMSGCSHILADRILSYTKRKIKSKLHISGTTYIKL